MFLVDVTMSLVVPPGSQVGPPALMCSKLRRKTVKHFALSSLFFVSCFALLQMVLSIPSHDLLDVRIQIQVPRLDCLLVGWSSAR